MLFSTKKNFMFINHESFLSFLIDMLFYMRFRVAEYTKAFIAISTVQYLIKSASCLVEYVIFEQIFLDLFDL